MLINLYKLDPDKTAMVGDSLTDYEASVENNITFFFEKNKIKQRLAKSIKL
jgi:phosphoglycolate phosphatase-like HAD superfamily hydrolase